MRCSDGHRSPLAHFAKGATSYLEVGVREGESLRVVLEAGPKINRLLLCDTWCKRAGGTGRGNHNHITELLDKLGYAGEVRFLDGRSQDTLPRLLAASSDLAFHSARRPARYDLSHVDGSHEYAHALADFRNAWSLTEGQMVIHDIGFQPVWKAALEFGKTAADATAGCVFGDWATMYFERTA